MFEEVVIEIPLESIRETRRGCRPLDTIRELQGLPHCDRLWLLAGQVHVDDLHVAIPWLLHIALVSQV